MKRKLTTKYMTVFSVSVMMVIVIWLGLVYSIIFSGKYTDQYKPQYLINRFEKYIDMKNGFTIKEKGKEILNKNNLWVQIIYKNGKVLYQYNVPNDVPYEYNVFEISKCVMDTHGYSNQTMFIKSFYDNGDYGLILGCDSHGMTKVCMKFDEGIENVIIKAVCLLFCICIFIEIGAGIYFSRNISAPIYEIIDDINNLESEENTEEINSKNKIFKTVFDSLEKLRQRLINADVARKYTENQRNEWIANVSHDMKTPLASIMGYAEIMTYENLFISEEDKKIYCKKIYKHAHSINELIEELKFSRLLENGQINLEKEETDICELLKECSDEVPSNYDSGRIIYDFSDGEIYAEIDRHLIKRCFVNIICNAIVHNNADVNIVIRCIQTDKIVVDIEDNGKGMTDEDIKNIFTRYYRGKKAKNVAGSGLGLAIANDIVKVHGGSIDVESKLGKGTKFRIIF